MKKQTTNTATPEPKNLDWDLYPGNEAGAFDHLDNEQFNEDMVIKAIEDDAANPTNNEDKEGFTPGEWEARYNTELFPNQTAIYGNDGDENGRVIAVMDISDKTDMANIDLVCAAPDMYKALKDLVFTASKLWDDVKCIKDTDSMKVTHPIIEQAKALLQSINKD